MTLSRRQALVAGAISLPASGVLLSMAKAQPPGAPPPAGGPAGGPAALGEDPLLAACLFAGGKRQIEVCRWAKERLQDNDCKAFAQAEIDEHEHIKAELKKFGYEPPAPAPVAGVQPAGGPPPGVPPTVALGRVAIPSPAANQVLIENEVKDQCIANYKAKMEKKRSEKGELKFDKAFVGDQLHEHGALRDQVEVFLRHASPDMQPTLRTGLEVINKHIATLEQLMEKLETASKGK